MADDSNRKPGLKLQNNKSMFANTKKPTQQDLDAKVKDIQEKKRSYNERAADAVGAYRKILEDKTVLQNKNIFSIDLEKDTIGKLVQLAVDMNQDEQEEEGMGSVGIIALLLRCLLIQRDKINSLDYSVNQLEKNLKTIELNVVDKKNYSE